MLIEPHIYVRKEKGRYKIVFDPKYRETVFLLEKEIFKFFNKSSGRFSFYNIQYPGIELCPTKYKKYIIRPSGLELRGWYE